MMHLRPVCAGLAVLALAACSSGSDSGDSSGAEDSSTTTESADATEVAEELKSTSSTAEKVVTVTEENDPNDLIGRPNGYDSAAILYDSEVSCDELGSECGVVVEVFSDENAARARGEYIQGILSEAPALGSEWDYVKGSVVLRVSGELKPTSNTKYAEAFGGEEVKASGTG